MPRTLLARWIQLITGHNNLSKHQNKINSLIDPACRLCEQAPETFIHFIDDCPYLELKRREILPNKIESEHAWSIKRLIEFSRLPCINELLQNDSYVYKDVIEIEHAYSTDTDSS